MAKLQQVLSHFAKRENGPELGSSIARTTCRLPSRQTVSILETVARGLNSRVAKFL